MEGVAALWITSAWLVASVTTLAMQPVIAGDLVAAAHQRAAIAQQNAVGQQIAGQGNRALKQILAGSTQLTTPLQSAAVARQPKCVQVAAR